MCALLHITSLFLLFYIKLIKFIPIFPSKQHAIKSKKVCTCYVIKLIGNKELNNNCIIFFVRIQGKSHITTKI